jgi:hypothetical protein
MGWGEIGLRNPDGPEAADTIMILLEALGTAAQQFRVYEASHRLKGAEEKARRNASMAEMCEAAIAKVRGRDARPKG